MTKKKIINLMFVTMICLFLCTACKSKIEKINNETSNSMFVVLEETNLWRVVFHKETNVMYAVSYSLDTRGVFTLLVDDAGAPLIWKGWNNQ